MKRLLALLSVIALIFTAIFAVGYLLKPEATQKNETKLNEDEVKQSLKKPLVQIAKAVYAPLIEKVYATGTLRGIQEAELLFKVSGEVADIFVHNGEHLKKGDALLQLNTDEIDLEIAKQKSKFLQLKDDLKLRAGEEHLSFEEEFLKIHDQRGLFRVHRELISKSDKLSLLKHRLGYTEALIQLFGLQLKKSYHTLKAPFSGRLSGLQLSKGVWISQGKSIGKLTDERGFLLRVGVLQEDARKMKRFAIVELPGYGVQGKIVGVDAEIDREKKLVQVDIEVPYSERLQSGSFVKTLIHTQTNQASLLVNKQALLERDNKRLLFVAREGKAVWCYVETGKENNEFVEILSSKMNLKPDEPVIIDGHYTLAHGAEIVINEELRMSH